MSGVIEHTARHDATAVTSAVGRLAATRLGSAPVAALIAPIPIAIRCDPPAHSLATVPVAFTGHTY